jgi:hypothetical protein
MKTLWRSIMTWRLYGGALWHEDFMEDHYDRLYEEALWHENFMKLETYENFISFASADTKDK